MNFAYAPPPPPPSANNGSANSKQNRKTKNSKGNKPQDKRFNRSNGARNSNNTGKADHQKQETIGISVLDLPTYLPNDLPSETVVSNEIDNVVDTQEDDDSFQNEEQLVKANSEEPTFIPGTSITLQTEEDIAKWIAERKKNWPTRGNVARKLESQAEDNKKSKPVESTPTASPSKRNAEDDNNNGPKKKQKNVCRFFQQHGHCKFGVKCKNIHEAGSKPANPVASSNQHDLTHYRRNINGIPVLIPKLYSNRTNSFTQNTNNNSGTGLSLFKHLVKQDHLENENKTILNFIQFLEKQGLIDHDVMKS
ncbi:nuclear fragile X mental retardation-interacting protein 1-domain-containing protein [Scheffersomyces xylosifermentans]|uniref:nuclear fragile X mental retardation-interacting protein 1-domain-containing protein n=1 Tax=Scheffersomyces xylosifermentans TaxID=1304137 RepID=UPI00315D829F